MEIRTVKLTLAVLLFICLVDVPYGYFQLVRFIAMIAFGLLAAQASQMGRKNEMIIYGALALLFQPLFKISLGRELWNMVDVIVGIGLLFSAFNSAPNAK